MCRHSESVRDIVGKYRKCSENVRHLIAKIYGRHAESVRKVGRKCRKHNENIRHVNFE